MVVGVEFLLHSNTGKRWIINTAQQKASAALGTNVAIGNFNLSFFGISPALDVYDVVVSGAQPCPEPALLRIDHARVGVTVTSLLHAKWYLNELSLDRPVVRVLVDKQGKDNLPQTHSSGPQSNTNLFDLGIRHAAISNGEVYYNNRKSVLNADLHELEFSSQFDTANPRYYGTLAYKNGHLQMESFNTINHNLTAEFEYAPNRFVLKNAVLSTPESKVVLNATLTDFSDPNIAAEYNILANGSEFRRILKSPTIPLGQISATGKVTYDSGPNVPFMDEVKLQGTLHSNQLTVSTPQLNGPVRDLQANYTVNKGTLRVNNLAADMLGGQLHGNLIATDITGAQDTKLNIALNHVSIGRLQSMLKAPALKNISATGSANANVTASWTKGFKNLESDVNLNFNSNLRSSTPHGAQGQVAAGSAVPANNQVANQNSMNARTSRSTTTSANNNGRSLVGGNASNTNANTGENSAAAQNTADAVEQQVASAAAPQSAGATPQSNAATQVTGHIQLHYSGKNNQLTVKNSEINTPQGNLKLNGSLNGRQGLAVNLNNVSLQKLESVAAMFSTSAKPAFPPGLSGTASFNGHVKGTTKAPNITGLLVVRDFVYNGGRWSLLRANIDAGPSYAALTNGLLTSPYRGRATFSANTGLKHWSFTKDTNFTVALNADQLHLANVAKAAGVTSPITGVINAQLQAHGTQESPIGAGKLNVSNVIVSGQPVRNANASFRSNGTELTANLGVQLPAGSINGSGTVNIKQKTYTAQLQSKGIQLGQLAAAKGMNLKGTLLMNASGAGSFENPQLNATVRVPKLEMQGQNISDINLQAQVANHVADVALNSHVVNTTLTGKAKINLTGNYEAVASLDTQQVPFAPLVAVYAPTQAGNITGETEFHASLRGPLKFPKAINAQMVISTLVLNYKNDIHLGAPQPVRVNYVNGVLNVQRTPLQGTETDLVFQGSVPIADRTAPMSLLLQGTVNLRIAQLLNPDLTSSGQLVFDINSYGQRASPNVEGQIRVVNASFATPDAPLGLQNGNGVLTLTPTRLEVTRFTGTVGGGTVTARGAVTYRPTIGFDLAANADSIRLLYPEGVRSGIGGQITLTGTPDTSYLRGQVNLQNLSFTPAFDLMDFMGQFNGAVVPPPNQGFTSNMQLALGIHAPQGINLASRELSLAGGLNLKVRGTAAEPVILGRVNLGSGDLIFLGNRYLLQGATIDFVNPVRTEPVLNANINTTIDQYNIAMRFEGPINRMRTNYTSDPALPPADIINLLAFGKTTEAAAANPNPPGNLAAQSTIASAVSGQVTSRLEKIAGISQLSIDPTLGGAGSGSQKSPGATITLKQRVTGKLFVTFSTDVTSTQKQVIQLEYQPSRRFSISGTRDQNGGFAVDTKIRKRW